MTLCKLFEEGQWIVIMALASVRSELLGKRLRAMPLTGCPVAQEASAYSRLYEELSKLVTQSLIDSPAGAPESAAANYCLANPFRQD